MEKLNKIFFRADGNTQIGLGHITRSLALADMLKDDFEIFVLIQNPTEAVRKQIQEVSNHIIELPSTEDYLQEAHDIAERYLETNNIMVIDGYHFQTEYQKILKEAGVKLVCIDDLHAWHFVADVVINHAGGVKESDYSCEPYTKLCLGMEYALLRSPFLEAAKQDRKIEKIENIFICFGGADGLNLTKKTVEACLEITQFKEIHAVVGSAYAHFESLQDFTKEYPQVHIHQNLNAQQMCELMQHCELAIVPASSIAYEVCSVRTYLITGWYVDNQKDIYQSLSKNDLGLGVENFQELANSISNFEMKTIYLQSQKQHFDGKSRERINKCFNHLIILKVR